MNTPVNFELAKLLKLKKFNLKCQRYYRAEGSSLFNDDFIEQESTDWNSSFYPDDVKSAPTITEVVMWLYEIHGIWIAVSHEMNDLHQIEWFWVAIKNGEEIANQYLGFNSPTEAYEAAINHCLTNLI